MASCFSGSVWQGLLQAVKIALEVKKYLVDGNHFDITQVSFCRTVLALPHQQQQPPAVEHPECAM